MDELLTPNQVARAIQVSESSVKRWCDDGKIRTRYTAGGHRRIPMDGLIEFLRTSKHQLLRPEVVGLPATTGQTTRIVERGAAQFCNALLAGDEERCRRIVLDLYLASHSISAICDGVFAAAFEEIGTKWECGDAEVYQERRGCEISTRVLHELRSLIPPPPANAPLAIGGTTVGDQYCLATTMAELVLRDAGWNAVSLGENLPFETLAAAIRENRPRLFWLSCSHLSQPDEFVSGYRALFDEFAHQVAFVVGGRDLTKQRRQQIRYAAFCDNMQHLETFAKTIHGLPLAPEPQDGSEHKDEGEGAGEDPPA